MTNYEKIRESVNNNESVHLLMLYMNKEKILDSSVEELAEIINKMPNNPCNYYCNNCGQKDVLLSECKQNIIKYLNS